MTTSEYLLNFALLGYINRKDQRFPAVLLHFPRRRLKSVRSASNQPDVSPMLRKLPNCRASRSCRRSRCRHVSGSRLGWPIR